MSEKYDVVVIGSGIVGASTAYNLAKRGVSTLVLERFGPNHTNGSSHGKSRIIRSANPENIAYTRLAKSAFDRWGELEAESGSPLMIKTGGLIFGDRKDRFISPFLSDAMKSELDYEIMSPSNAMALFPQFTIGSDEVAVYDPSAGILFPERCVDSYSSLARGFGAEFHFNEEVLRWDAASDCVAIETQSASYKAGRVVLAAGAWNAKLISDVDLGLRCERQVVFWFKPNDDSGSFMPGSMPVFICCDYGRHFYGFPDLGDGVKAAQHHGGEAADPDSVRRAVGKDDEGNVRAFLGRRIPAADGTVTGSSTCLYTNTPTGDFIIDFHPKHSNVLMVSACCGMGFKFASITGEIAADLAMAGKTEHDISLFGLR